MIEVASHRRADTEALAAGIAPLVTEGDVILLGGELGAGKTVFTQGLARALGIGDVVTSPTFTLVRDYEGPGGRRLLHADLYRLDHLQEVVDLGLAELIEDATVTVIEWGEVARPVLPPAFLEVRIAFGKGAGAGDSGDAGDDERVLSFTPVGPAWASRVPALCDALKKAGQC